MKKSLLAVLLAVALVAPVFAADEGAMELDIKAGYNLMSRAEFENWKSDVNAIFTTGVDFFYYVMPQLAIGAGVQYVFKSRIKQTADLKTGWTDIYAQAKYVIETGNDFFNNIYPLVQIGYGILNVDSAIYETDSNGLCWGIGAGTTIKENFVFEILYSNANGSFKLKNGPWSTDLKYNALQLKVGYKFAF